MDTTAPDYGEAVTLIVEKLAGIYRRDPEDVLTDIVESADDAFAFRVQTARNDEWELPLPFASAMVWGAQQMLLSSACTVMKPQRHHPRMSRREAQEFLRNSKFRHTRPGSFVLNVSCPVNALNIQTGLWPHYETPFVRKATLVVYRSLRKLVTAVETDTIAGFLQDAKAPEDGLIVSSNFCEALASFGDDEIRNSVEVGIKWAPVLPHASDDTLAPETRPRVSVVRVQHDYFPIIREVGRELRASTRFLNDTFFATVEQLEGDMGDDNRRAGDVVFSLFTLEGEVIRARASLTADEYEMAAEAHMEEGKFVKVAGTLHPGRQPRLLADITSFELVARQ